MAPASYVAKEKKVSATAHGYKLGKIKQVLGTQTPSLGSSSSCNTGATKESLCSSSSELDHILIVLTKLESLFLGAKLESPLPRKSHRIILNRVAKLISPLLGSQTETSSFWVVMLEHPLPG